MTWIKKKVVELLISCLILLYLIKSIINKKSSKINLIHIVITFIIFYKYSHNLHFSDHGYFNFIAYFFFLALFATIFIIVKGFLYIIKKSYLSLIIICIISIFFFLSYIFFDPINCNEWAKGINNTSIENDVHKYGCQIKIPKKCTYKILKYTQDLTKIKGIKCGDLKINARQKYLSASKSINISKETKRIGWPLTNKDPIFLLDCKEDIMPKKFFLSHLIDMDKTDQINMNLTEIIVDFTKSDFGELIINVNFNETLSKERKQLEYKNTPFSNNIMIIFLDSVSRANGLRKLKKTIHFFEKFISYKGGHHERYPTENFHSFQFFNIIFSITFN